MRIAYMIDTMNTFGGAQRVIAVLCNQSINDNQQTHLILTGNVYDSVYPLSNGLKVFCCTESSSRISKLLRIRKYIKENHIDYVVSFMDLVNIYAILSLLGSKIPVIISERIDPDRNTRLIQLLDRLFYNLSATAVVQTTEIADKFRKFYKKNIYVIPNPINDQVVCKGDYSITNKAIAVGRLTPQKNYKLMIDAFCMFRKNYPDYVLEIYGRGYEKDSLTEYIIKNGCDEFIFLKGNAPDIIQFEHLADFYIMTSDYEGMPNALAEAMAAGLPCISTNCDGGGAASLITNDYNGILVNKGDKNGLVDAMIKITKDRVFAYTIGQAAHDIKNKLSSENIYNMWKNVLLSLK